MKILLLANHINYGGITAYLLNICRALHGKEGLEFVIASRGGELESEFDKIGVEHLRIPLSTKCEISPKVFFSFVKLLPYIKQNKIDLIHANTRVAQVLASFLSCATKKPYLSTCHGYFKPRFTRRAWPCWGKKVIAVSDQVREHLIQDFHLDAGRIELIYNGVDVLRYRPFSKEQIMLEKKRLGLDLSKKIVGHIGRLSSVKGQKYLCLAAFEILKNRNDVQFLIIGDGEEEVPLKKIIKDKNISSSVFLRSSVSDTALALNLMDIFVMPSLQEGLGLSILEAQAQGVPVVASRVGGIPSIIEDRKTGLLCFSSDESALALNISELLDNNLLKAFLSENALISVREKFSLQLMAKKTRSLYEDISC